LPHNLTNDLIKIGQQLVIPPFKRTGYIVHEEQEQPITPMRPDTSNYYVNGYEVKRGDTLTSIAKIQYDIPPSTDTYSIVSEIKKLNPDKTKGSLRIGIMLILPEKTRDGCTLKQYNDTRIVEKEKIDYYNKKGVIIDNNNPKTYQDEEILNIISTFRSQKSKENHPDISDEYILECITKAAEAFSLDKKLLTLLIAQESAFNPTATSSCGAVGMCQLMLSTAQVDAFNALKKGLSREELQKLCPEGEINTKNLKDIRLNIMLGAAYLKKLLTMYNGDVELALIAYNWGMGHANKIKNKKSFKIPTETYGYVTNIVNNYKKSYTPVA